MADQTYPEMENVQPLPWRAEMVSADYWRWRVCDANDFLVFIGVTREEAEFIVRAVNSHHALVEALKDVLEFFAPAPGQRTVIDCVVRAEYAIAQAEATDHV